MADIATAILHTPWDCQWSRFARRTTGGQTRGILWECVHTGSRVAIAEVDCASCPYFAYEWPLEGARDRTKVCERAAKERSAQQLQGGIRVSLFVLAAIFAACGFIVLTLTMPLAVPFTITMWMGAATSFMAGVFGNFRSHADGTFRGFLPPRT